MEIKHIRSHIEPTALEEYCRPGFPDNYTRPGHPYYDYPRKYVMCYGTSGH